MNIATLAICGAAGAATVHAIRAGNRDDITPRLIVALILGGVVYFLVSSLIVNANSQALGILSTSLQSAIARTVVDKLPMVAGNVTVGILVVVLLARDRMWLLLVPPVAVLMHQAYVYRSRIADERRLWRDFADIAGSLNQLDERSVAVAALTGTLRLFKAESAEIWVDRSPGEARGYRGRAELSGVDITHLTSTIAPVSTPPGATRALTIGGQRVGELRLWMPLGSSLDSRDHMALSAVADALASALHDALAHNALTKLAARSLHDSYQDVLTGVANRSSLLTEGAEKLRSGGRTPVVLYVVGINRFKEVNDTLGPTAGDDLLRITAGRLAAFAGATDLVARIGGDEFAILSEIEGVADPLAYATTHARSLAEELTVATDLAGLQVAVEVSVGVAVGRADEFDIAELVRRSGIAMRRAKRGAGAIAVFDASDTPAGSVDRLSVLVDLREAMEHDDQLVLAVQPAVALATGQPIAAETLIRWNHPRRGALVPRDFVDLVDQSDLVMPFTRYVLDRALRLADEWCRAGMPMRVSVNLSPRSLSDPNLPGDVSDLLKRYGVEPNMLTLEITESAVVTGQPIVAEVLAALPSPRRTARRGRLRQRLLVADVPGPRPGRRGQGRLDVRRRDDRVGRGGCDRPHHRRPRSPPRRTGRRRGSGDSGAAIGAGRSRLLRGTGLAHHTAGPGRRRTGRPSATLRRVQRRALSPGVTGRSDVRDRPAVRGRCAPAPRTRPHTAARRGRAAARSDDGRPAPAAPARRVAGAPWASVGIAQRGVRAITRRTTSSPSPIRRPTHPSSTNARLSIDPSAPRSSGQPTTMFGR